MGADSAIPVVTVLYAITMALGAALLFSVQPMVARMALPGLGGSPAVWNTSMAFFQGAVLAGYALAHGLAGRVGTRAQVILFAALMAGAAVRLPIGLPNTGGLPSSSPVLWLLGWLIVEVGLPAVMLAVTSPLLQRWYGQASRSDREPYFLYAASNLGSLGALAAYPFVVERFLPLEQQARLWTFAYGLWFALILLCATSVWRGRRGKSASDSWSVTRAAVVPVPDDRSATTLTVSRRRWASWVALAAIPAALLQGCTLFLTSDIASLPLLWVAPLGLYLLTFVVAFSQSGGPLVAAGRRSLPFLASALMFVMLVKATQPVAILMALHLAFLFAAGLALHGRLVELRPPRESLTGFYLTLALGGVAGGLFCAVAAPLLFHSVAEYPLAMVFACAALPRRGNARSADPAPRRAAWDLAWTVLIAGGVLMLGLVVPWFVGDQPRLRNALVFGPAAVVCCALLDRPPRLALGLAATFAAGALLQERWTGLRHAERNFFGLTRVTRDATLDTHQLVHGNTIHGRQFRDPTRQGEPLTYYHRAGPLGSLFEAFERQPGPRRVGIIGLGVGSMAAYARPDEEWTLFEIDPAVIRVANDAHWFTFLARCEARSWRIVEGDGRLRLAEEPEEAFDLLVLDAFSSDAIPVHLLTREALRLYFRKLRPGGWLAVHISNRYLNLEPVVAALASDAGWVCRSANDMHEGDHPGKEPSHWLLLARREPDLKSLARHSLWVPADHRQPLTIWTDQRSSVFEVFDWR